MFFSASVLEDESVDGSSFRRKAPAYGACRLLLSCKAASTLGSCTTEKAHGGQKHKIRISQTIKFMLMLGLERNSSSKFVQIHQMPKAGKIII